MMRRPPGEGTVANRFIFALAILFVPWLVDAQQQQNSGQTIQRRYESSIEGPNSDALHTLEVTRQARQAEELDTPFIADRRKNTLSVNQNNNNIIQNKNDASAIATLAPANPAVRAPSARQASNDRAGLTSPQIARSLEDWEVEDFVLLATIDGKLNARDRKTGKERWTLEVDPMVVTQHHRRNRLTDHEDYHPVDDYLWIVEPRDDGPLYVFVTSEPHPGLVSTKLTMKQIVEELAPFADEHSPIVYTGDKKTTMVTLDARTGRPLKWFGSGGSQVNEQQSCLRKNGLEADNDECSTSVTLTLGRTDYTVDIHRKDGSGHTIATLTYSEWGPNNYDQDLNRQYRKTMDDKYILSSHNGGIFAYDEARTAGEGPNPIFNQKLPYPAARVFDIARPWGTENKDAELIVLPQPSPPWPWLDDERKDRIFLNHTEDGSWYAMSGTRYPLITDCREQALCEKSDYWQKRSLWEDLNDDAQLYKALVGLHSIERARPDPILTISPPQVRGPGNDTTIIPDLPPVTLEPPSFRERLSGLPGNAASTLTDFINNPIMTIVILGLMFLYKNELVKWLRKAYKTKLQTMLESAVQEKEIETVLEEVEKPEILKVQAVEAVAPQEDSLATSTDDDAHSSRGRADSEAGKLQVPETQEEAPLPSPEKEKKKAHRGRRGGVKHRKGRANSQGPAAPPPPDVDNAVRNAQKLGEQPEIEPDVRTLPNGVDEISGPILRLNSLEVNTDKLIGTGSNGTMVFEGKFDGRNVAVKRMLIQFFDIASQETKLLRESDDHPNVIRYYAQQQSAGFLYIALELCPASLADVIEKPHLHRELAQGGEKDLPNVLSQITNGLQHLHNLRIVHRDLKPQNILVSLGKDGKPRLLVSDFGLCKKLEGEQSSFRATTAHAAGTSGWRAPELLLDDDVRDGQAIIGESTHSGSGSILVSADVMPNRRATRAIDIFSLGLVFFYVLTKGGHPFDCGDRYMREVNIRKGNYNLRPLEVLGDFTYEAKDLIASMLEQEPKRRPSARQVMAHPFFWPAKKRLNFLCDVSDHFEKEKRDPPTSSLQELEKWAPEVCHGDFLKLLGKEFVESMGKQRKYTGTRLLDLLRALRNKKNHYEDMPDGLKKTVGPLPEGYLSFWTRRFPNLLITCWNIVYYVGWDEQDRFLEYYAPAGL